MGYWKREYTERKTVKPLFRRDAKPAGEEDCEAAEAGPPTTDAEGGDSAGSGHKPEGTT